ncbi:hypothetical protein V2J09_006358 [Rumex salicifolius]
MAAAQERMKWLADLKRTEHSFEIADRRRGLQTAIPPQSRIHPVFHVSLLKTSLGSHIAVSTDLPVQLDRHTWLPPKILEAQQSATTLVQKWLIQWEGYTEDEATWESAADILARFPFLRLVYKPCFKGVRMIGLPLYLLRIYLL